MKNPSEADLRAFAEMLGIKPDDFKNYNKPNPHQKKIDEIDKMLKRYGSKK